MRKRLNATKAPATQIATAASGTEVKPKPNGRELKTAKLLLGIKQDSVNDLLRDGGVGEKYTKPGEWAAAFRALYVAGALKGTAPEVTRWAVKQGYIEESALETVKKAWSGEWNVAKPLLQLVRENARFTVHYQSMQHRLNAAKLNPPQPAASIPVAPSNEPEIVNIEEYLSDKCSLDICDKAAKKIGLSINKKPWYPRLFAHTRADYCIKRHPFIAECLDWNRVLPACFSKPIRRYRL